LHHLYDWVALRDSPLVIALGLRERDDPPLALRRTITAAIEALKPQPQVAPKARAWRTYQLLYARFVEQFNQAETAAELGVSVRHLRREEALAIRTLAAYLWDRYDAALRWREESARLARAPQGLATEPTLTPSPEQELGWLAESVPAEPISLGDVVQSVLKLVDPVANAANVRVDIVPAPSLPNAVAQGTAVRQALLSVFTTAIRLAPGSWLTATMSLSGLDVAVEIETAGGQVVPQMSGVDRDRMTMARRLAEVSGGSLSSTFDPSRQTPFQVALLLPAAEQTPVLVIDDNEDTLKLLQRYLSNTRYKFVGAAEPERALEAAVDAMPGMVVLDVMLPQIDGWELMGRLHQHPKTAGVPVVVCSILPQEQLAASLGAAGFIRKPVSREALLAELDRQFELLQRGSR
jgi:CheY-like chemotaxis protein